MDQDEKATSPRPLPPLPLFDTFAGYEQNEHDHHISSPNGHAVLTGQCGDTMEMFLLFQNERIVEARYKTDGCQNSKLCGRTTVQAAMGKSPLEVYDLTAEQILDLVKKFTGKDVPEHEEHCAYLSVRTLQDAVDAYMKSVTKHKPL